MSTSNDLANDTVAVILAGGKGTRLAPLTSRICKPALPFGAAYRSIDFSPSNCVNSGIRRVGVPTQHKPAALLRHMGRVWDGVVTKPGHFVSPWPAEECAPGAGYRGTADAVYRTLDLIEKLDRRLVLILAGDHVYKMDYRPMLEQHCERGAAVTIGCVDVPIEEAHEFGVMSTDRRSRIDRFVEKPKTRSAVPGNDSNYVSASMGIYVFDTDFLARVLRLDAASIGSRHDFGGDILPRLIREADAFAYPFRTADGTRSGYCRDIGTIGAYWRAHMELLGPEPQVRLDDPGWPLPADGGAPTSTVPRRPTKDRGAVERSLVAADCTIAGRVERSVLFGGVEIRRGAEVADAVILPGAVIGAGCRLRGVIVDSGCRIPDGAVVERAERESPRWQPAVLTAEDAASLSPRSAYVRKSPGRRVDAPAEYIRSGSWIG